MSLSRASSTTVARLATGSRTPASNTPALPISRANVTRKAQKSVTFATRVLAQSASIFGKNTINGSNQSRQYSTRTQVFKLADIGEGIHEVEVLQWFVKEGDKIEEFDRVCEVQSDKATVEIKSPYHGVVGKLHHKIGDMAKVGHPLIDVLTDGAAAAPAHAAAAAPAQTAPVAAAAAPVASAQSDEVTNEITTRTGLKMKVLATPAVRHMAKVNSVDLAAVGGTGRDGRVTKSDLLGFLQGGQKASLAAAAAAAVAAESNKPAAATKPAAAALPVGADWTEPLRGYRKAMAKKMTEALTIPHFGYCEEIAFDNLAKLRHDLKPVAESLGVKLSYMPFIIKACSLALKRYPLLNSSINKELTEITYHASHNIGIAVDTPAGLVVPNIKNCQNLSIFEIASELNRIIKLAQENKLPPSDLSGGTFSLSNIGAIGGTYAKPVVVVPEVCIGALGKIQKLPRYDAHGHVFPSQIMQVSWSADHRAIDGATIANFSNLMKRYLEHPQAMLADMK